MLDKHLKRYLKKTGRKFAIVYLEDIDKWQVTIGKASAKSDKLNDALRQVWLSIEDVYQD